jgi:hypothetical protein
MKTRLIIIASILLFSSRLIMAQTTETGKISFAVLGGVNFQTFNGKYENGDKIENDMLIAYHAGVNVAVPIAPEFYFQPGVMFSVKGAKNTSIGFPIESSGTNKLSYIELPLNLVYKGLLGNGYVMVGFGPYVGYAIKGKTTTESGLFTADPDIEFKKVVDSSDPDLTTYFKAMDAGGNIFFGYEMAAGIFLQFNAQLGMLNIAPEDNRLLRSNPEVKNTGYGLSLGYRF